MTKRLVLRTSNKDGKAYNDFQWPSSGPVECQDWNPAAKCGNGLHGILWPEGDWSEIKQYKEELWQVVEVEESDLVQIEGKVKFPRGNVIYSGNMAVAFNMVAKEFLERMKKETPADIKASGGLSDNGEKKAQIGSSGYSAKIGSSGDYAKIGSSGHSAKIGSSGDYAQIGSSGDYAQIDSTGKDAVIACAGSVSRFRAGEGGCISAPWHDGKRTRFAVGYIGENIKADTWYTISETGEFVEAV